MATIVKKIDVYFSVYRSVGPGSLTGLDSVYADKPHPATGNKIKGFTFDRTIWKAEEGFNNAHFVPNVWDPDISTVEAGLFQSGTGDDSDLQVEQITAEQINHNSTWLPKIKHGFYYDLKDEHYLFSDDSHVDSVSFSGVAISGGNFVQLTYTPKAGVPVVGRQFKWHDPDAKYLTYKDFLKVVRFTGGLDEDSVELNTLVDPSTILWTNVDPQKPELLLDYGTSPPTAFLNDQYCKPIGATLITTSGLSTTELNDDYDHVGATTGLAEQELHLTYSPIDRTQPVQLILELGNSDFQLWEGVSQLASGVFNQVLVDYDLGVVKFGTAISGGIPSFGYTVYAAYSPSVAIEYEPIHARDHVEDTTADTNPIRRYQDGGFVFLRTSPIDVNSIELTVALPEIAPDVYGPLFVGNQFATVKATAYTRTGDVVEGEEVTFEILSSSTGSFGTFGNTISAITNGKGEAKTLYNAPRSIDTLGSATNEVTVDGGSSTLFLENYRPRETNSALFLFQVAREDAILGIPQEDLLSFYEQYLTDEEIPVSSGINALVGPVLNFSIGSLGNYSWIAGARADQIKWEIYHRLIHNLRSPVAVTSEDLKTGKKTVVATVDGNAINPHTGTTPAVVPVQPSSFDITNSGTLVEFAQVLPEVTEISDHKSYLVVGPTKVQLRAFAYNERLNATIYSNTVEILIDLPAAMNGLLQIDAVNTAPSGLLQNADYYDQARFDLSPVEITATSGLLPLGFRLRSAGVTLASALDGITFLDLNPELQFITTPAVGHEFRVNL